MPRKRINADNVSYFHYTKPSRLDKAVHTFEGLIKGIAIDGVINEKENETIQAWFKENKLLANRPPFTELMPKLKEAIHDGFLDEEEKKDLLWLCNNLHTNSVYYSAITSDMQRLHGLLGGIVADNKIEKAELEGLSDWLEEHQHLKGNWPYDEIESLIISVLADGIVDEKEQEFLYEFFKDFSVIPNSSSTEKVSISSLSLTGICAASPQIEFEGEKFCLTGSSEKMPRVKIVQIIEDLGGIYTNKLTQDTGYLVVGAEGSDCWAFSCYGRKVETAMQWRKEGYPILVVHEYDFWDEISDLNV